MIFPFSLEVGKADYFSANDQNKTIKNKRIQVEDI